jgi:hypothetical protein
MFVAISLFALSSAICSAQQINPENIPDGLLKIIKQGSFARTYDLDGSVNPFYLRGDFDGDGKADYAFRIKSKSENASGIAIWLSTKRKMVILGAGIPFTVAGSSVSNLNFLDIWQVYEKKIVERGVGVSLPPRLLGEAILAGKSESASGLIYWNGKFFAWYQQGD